MAQKANVAPTEKPEELRFVEGLRERGYYDLALEYLDRLRNEPGTPAELKAVIDYEQGRSLLDEAGGLADLDRRRVMLEQARVKLDAFVKANPNHALAPAALTQIARMLFERGLTAALQAAETVTEDDADAARKKELEQTRLNYLTEARASFADARTAYDQAITRLRKTYESFDRFITDEDPKRIDRDAAHEALLDAELQRALVDYEDAQTYPEGDAKRGEMLETARNRFKTLYDNYRGWIAGFFAHMWEGKCYEEQGKLGEAMGIYNELMDQPARELAPLKRKVAYFQVIIDGKRGEHALAVDRAAAWLNAYPNAVRTDEGTGVRFELARNLLAQLPERSPREKEAYIRQAVELLSEVVRYYSPFKPEAVELLKKYKPSVAMAANELAKLSFDDAYSQAESAVSTNDWERAIALLRQAIRKAEPAREPDKANRARYLMAYACYMDKRYYEAAVLADHLARHYPQGGLSARSTEIGLAALTMAYNTYNQIDRTADLERLIDLARYTAKTWPDADQGDAARFMLGEIALGRGRYTESAEAFESVREDSPRRLDALVKSGDAHWRHAAALRSERKTAEADAEAAKARELMETALQARRESRVPNTDPGFITNVNALAEIDRAEGRPEEAVKLLEPVAEALNTGDVSSETVPLRIALLITLLRSHIAAGQSDKAIEDMKALEAAGGEGAMLTQLYFELGRSLQREMDALEASSDPLAAGRLSQTRQAYSQFLQALAASESGQTYDSLMFAGESLLALGEAEQADVIFDRVLETYSKDDVFRKQKDSGDRLLRARLRKVEAVRKQGEFAEAQKLLDAVKKDGPKLLEPRLEQGYLYEDQARAERSASRWNAALKHWQDLANQLQRGRPKRVEYYEALYHVAVALQGLSQKQKAASTLKGVMTLSPTVGNADMKARYEELLSRLEQ